MLRRTPRVAREPRFCAVRQTRQARRPARARGSTARVACIHCVDESSRSSRSGADRSGSRYNRDDHGAGPRPAILNTPTQPERATLDLERSLTYRIAELAGAVEIALARVYASRFALTLLEWRVLAVLAQHPGASATQVAKRARLGKVAVSRAVASLMRAQRLERTRAESDRRRSNLQLTARGRALYDEIVPWSLAYEHALLRGMTARNREKLDALLDALLERARNVRADRIVVKKS